LGQVEKILAVGVVAVVAAGALQSLQTSRRQLQARTIRIRAGRIRFEGNRLIVPLIVSNPNSETVVVRSVVGEAWLNDNKVANVEMFKEVPIKANDKTTIDLNMRLMALQLVDTVLDMMNKKLAVNIGFTGSVNVDNRVTPVSLNYKIV
jgi:LEA14-like dessication related protein